MKWKVKKGDFVIVRSGSYRGIKGEVLSVNRSKDTLIVSGVNMVQKHKKGQNEPGSIVSAESPIHKSNVALFDASNNTWSKIGVKLEKSGDKTKKVRFYKKSNMEVK
jgi:large subunit ribosomal protein L24